MPPMFISMAVRVISSEDIDNRQCDNGLLMQYWIYQAVNYEVLAGVISCVPGKLRCHSSTVLRAVYRTDGRVCQVT